VREHAALRPKPLNKRNKPLVTRFENAISTKKVRLKRECQCHKPQSKRIDSTTLLVQINFCLVVGCGGNPSSPRRFHLSMHAINTLVNSFSSPYPNPIRNPQSAISIHSNVQSPRQFHCSHPLLNPLRFFSWSIPYASAFRRFSFPQLMNQSGQR